MKNWKDKVLGILAGIGVMALLMGSYAQQPKGVWEMHIVDKGGDNSGQRPYAINTQTGEVRKYETNSTWGPGAGHYIVMYEVETTPAKKEVRVND